ncbi:glycosyltransferase family 39 protein [Flavobacterium sedimenticola]|uniref:Glycosyltransferase family 39 protein n=1 Tax=Flavobacterium sedimenticola TaxID=3043286 RepID=A0ABT6XT37_9FLAO|nr:glycosyltransferase family 39 protein [Flavobacterium sedimenticola]MDI9258267.1 glycosyltransferase family 39 protein [Flavobacterium sedimenticola]
MSAVFRKYRYYIFIILVGLGSLAVLNGLLQLDQQTIIFPDCDNYLQSAQKMYHKFTGHFYRPMVMAFITGIPYLFGSSDAGIFTWSLVVNIFCWLSTSILLFEILKNFVSPKKAFGVAILPFLVVGNTVLNFHLLTENIFVFCIMLAFYTLLQYYKTRHFGYLSFSLAVFISSMLIKPGAKFLAIVIVLFYFKELLKNYRQRSMIFFYGSVLMVLIQVVGMRIQYGDFTISYIDGVTYHNYICSKAECFKNGTTYDQINNPRAEYLFTLDFTEQKKIAAADLKNQLQNNFPNFVKAYFDDVKENTISGNSCIHFLENKKNSPDFDFWKTFFFDVTKWQNRLLSLLAVVLAGYFMLKNFRTNRWKFVIAFFIAYIIILSGISCGQGDRFHLVTFPFVFLLLGLFVYRQKGTTLFSEPPQT